MCEKFESVFKTYYEAVLAHHPKYSSAKYKQRAEETVTEVMNDVLPLFFKANPFFATAIDSIVLSSVTDELIESYTKSKKSKREKKPIRTVNAYTAIFIPIVRKIAEPILMKYDEEESGVYYNRITNVNSIASKIFKNITDASKYSDYYVYEDSAIQCSAKHPENGDKIVAKYAAIVKQMEEDKKYIEEQIVDTPVEELKETKARITAECIEKHSAVYNSINQYVITFMDTYKDALRDLCIDKPLKKNQKEETSEEEAAAPEEPEQADATPVPVPLPSFIVPPPEQLGIPVVDETPVKTEKPKKRRTTKKN